MRSRFSHRRLEVMPWPSCGKSFESDSYLVYRTRKRVPKSDAVLCDIFFGLVKIRRRMRRILRHKTVGLDECEYQDRQTADVQCLAAAMGYADLAVKDGSLDDATSSPTPALPRFPPKNAEKASAICSSDVSKR